MARNAPWMNSLPINRNVSSRLRTVQGVSLSERAVHRTAMRIGTPKRNVRHGSMGGSKQTTATSRRSLVMDCADLEPSGVWGGGEVHELHIFLTRPPTGADIINAAVTVALKPPDATQPVDLFIGDHLV